MTAWLWRWLLQLATRELLRTPEGRAFLLEKMVMQKIDARLPAGSEREQARRRAIALLKGRD